MTVGSEWKNVMVFTFPLMLGNVLQLMYNTIDGVVVGNVVGEAALAAVGTCSFLSLLYLSIAAGLSVGVGVVVSQNFGAGKLSDMQTAISTSVILTTVLGVLTTVVAIFTSPLLIKHLLAVPDDLLELTNDYYLACCFGIPFMFLYNCVSAILRGLGNSKSSLYFLAISSVVNLVLDLLFVAAFKWGVVGAAVATVIANIFACAASVIYMLRKVDRVEGAKVYDREVSRLLLKLGIPNALQQAVVSVGNLLMQRLINSFEQESMAAYSVGTRINSYVYSISNSFQQGLASFVGQNIGANRYDRVNRGSWHTAGIAFLICCAMNVVLYIFATPLCALFGVEGVALERAAEMTRFLSLVYEFYALYAVMSGVLQGAGDTVVLSIATLASLILRVGSGYLFVGLDWMSYEAAWTTMPVGWIGCYAVVGIRLISGKWKKSLVKE